MTIINNDTTTGELTAIKAGDEISNGIGTFGKVESVDFKNHDDSWEFKFTLVGGGLIEAIKVKNSCSR